MITRIIKPLPMLFCVLITAAYAQKSVPGSPNPAADSFLTVDKHASNLVRVDPRAHWAGYRTYRLVPAVYEPSTSKHPLQRGELWKMESAVDRSLHRTFKNSLKGEGALLEVRPILTSVKRTNTFLNVLGFAAVQAPISFGGASVRYELLDGESGDLIGVVSCKRNARPWNVYPWNVLYNFTALGQGSVILKNDSGRLRKDLARLGKLSLSRAQDPVVGAE